MDFTELFVSVDEFWVKFRPSFEKSLLEDGRRRRLRPLSLCPSEIMTLLIAFQTSHYRTFKHFYLYLLRNHRRDFPGLVSYQRFVEWIPSVTVPLFTYLINHGLGPVTGISFIDSTALAVCGNKRIRRHRVFRGLAQVGKTTLGWFYGFKLHLIINDRGDLLAFHLTPGNGDDRQVVPAMTQRPQKLWGKLFGDKGYISQKLFESLYGQGVKLITSIRSNMSNRLQEFSEKILLRKRSLIETVNDQLKNICQIEHTRHRSPVNFLVHLIAGLIAYTRQPKKPSLKFHPGEESGLALRPA